jgi:hypothetical protein
MHIIGSLSGFDGKEEAGCHLLNCDGRSATASTTNCSKCLGKKLDEFD